MPLTSTGSPSFGPKYRGKGSYGPAYGKKRSSVRRKVISAAVVLILVAGAVGGLLVEKQRRADRRAEAARLSQASAESTVSGFVAAWNRGDVAQAVSYVDPAQTATASRLLTGLPVETHATKIGVTQTGGVSSTVDPGGTYKAAAAITGLGTASWNGHVPLVLRDNVWKVAFEPSVLEPSLGPGGKFVYRRDANNGDRGRVLMADGASMLTADPDLAANLRGQVEDHIGTAAEAAKLGPLFLAGDEAGTSGLEKAYNAKLQGTPGGSLTVDDAAGHVVATLLSLTKVPAADLKTTLSTPVQRAAEAGLVSVSAPAGSIVAVDVKTGRVLAMANKPVAGEVRALTAYPPGSTFKIVTTVAALAAGLGTSTVLDCQKNVTIDGRTLKNSENEAFGNIGLAEAFAVSCNTYFAQLAVKVDQTKPGLLVKTARQFGFATGTPQAAQTGAGTILPVPGFGGSYPTPKDLAQVAGQSFGQDLVQASPLQMASVVAGAATGTWKQPVLTPTGPQTTHALPAGTAATLRSLMAGVLSGNGTAAGVAFPGGTIGKTGTAETGNGGDDSWFVGVRGGVAFAAEFDNAGFGADVAAPACAAFLDALGNTSG